MNLLNNLIDRLNVAHAAYSRGLVGSNELVAEMHEVWDEAVYAHGVTGDDKLAQLIYEIEAKLR